MSPQDRIQAFIDLGNALENLVPEEKMQWAWQAQNSNNWFTPANVELAMAGIIHYLQEDPLRKWIEAYDLQIRQAKNVGLVMAGNTPAVGFHDFMCVLLSGHHVFAKASSHDPVLLKKIASLLIEIEPRFQDKIYFIEKLNTADAIIATSTENTARYFIYYFSKVPNIIRQNRTSCAVLTGLESEEELLKLGNDIFQYFGLGSRSVSKLYVPTGYDFTTFFQRIESYSKVMEHHKYVNNYDYNKSILLVNRIPHQDNGFLLLRESEAMVSPISVVYFEPYTQLSDLHERIGQKRQKIQTVVAKEGLIENSMPFGEAQKPNVWDYADEVDTMQFLTSL